MTQTSHTVIIVICILVALDVAAYLIGALILRRRGVKVRRSRFGLALVFDGEDVDGDELRMLNVNGTYQSICYTQEGRRNDLVCLYHQYFAEVIAIAQETLGTGYPASALVLGGGGFSFPKWLVAHQPQATVDAVEIDPTIIGLARQHFYLDELEAHTHAERDGRLRIICDDGWEVMRRGAGRWDIIVNDAFRAKRPLGPLTGTKGALVVRDHLSGRGIYLANVMGALEGGKARALRETIDAFTQAFAYIYLFPEKPEEPGRPGVNALVATNLELPISRRYRLRASSELPRLSAANS